MRLYLSIISLFLLLMPLSFYAAGTLDNVGFVQKNIWYSQDPFFEGDTITIYTVVFNSGSDTVTGVVEFYDKTVILGKQNFTVEPGTFKNLSVDWNVLAGDHVISAQIVDSEVLLPGGEKESTLLELNKTEEDKRFVPKTIVEEDGNTLNDEVAERIEDVQDFIKDKTPDVVEEKVSKITSGIEEWREKTGDTLKEKVEEVKQKLEEIKKVEEEEGQIGEEVSEKPSFTKAVEGRSKLQTPFTYAKLWFLKLLSFIFAHKLLFYGLTILLIFFILRFIWRKAT